VEGESGCELTDLEAGEVLEFAVVAEIPQERSEYGGCGPSCPGYEVYPLEGIVDEWDGAQLSGKTEAPSFGAALTACVEGCVAHITLEMWPVNPKPDEPSKYSEKSSGMSSARGERPVARTFSRRLDFPLTSSLEVVMQ
jgi:hypothetical protein